MKLKIDPHSKYLSLLILFLIYFVQIGLLIVARNVNGGDDIIPTQIFLVSPLLFLSLLFLCWQLFLEEHSNHKIIAVVLALLSGFCLYLSFMVVGLF